MAAEPLNPLQKATWLVECVAKTKGAEHLKLSSRKVNLWQYVGADIVLFVAVLVVLGSKLTVQVFRTVFTIAELSHKYLVKTTINTQNVGEKKRQ